MSTVSSIETPASPAEQQLPHMHQQPQQYRQNAHYHRHTTTAIVASAGANTHPQQQIAAANSVFKGNNNNANTSNSNNNNAATLTPSSSTSSAASQAQAQTQASTAAAVHHQQQQQYQQTQQHQLHQHQLQHQQQQQQQHNHHNIARPSTSLPATTVCSSYTASATAHNNAHTPSLGSISINGSGGHGRGGSGGAAGMHNVATSGTGSAANAGGGCLNKRHTTNLSICSSSSSSCCSNSSAGSCAGVSIAGTMTKMGAVTPVITQKSSRTIPSDKINLRLILVSGKTKEFLFNPSDSAGDIAQTVFDNWPEDWEREAVSKAEILRLIYQGRFLHCNVTLGALGLPLGKTTVMHLVPRDNLPEPNSQDQRQKSKGGSSRCCSTTCCIL